MARNITITKKYLRNIYFGIVVIRHCKLRMDLLSGRRNVIVSTL